MARLIPWVPALRKSPLASRRVALREWRPAFRPHFEQLEDRSGLYVIDLRIGVTVHWLRIEGIVGRLYGALVLPGVTRPTALGFKTDESWRTLSVGEESCLFPKGDER